MRNAIAPLGRFLVTPTVSKHRVFAWLSGNVLPDHQLIVFARDDDYVLGVLQSRAHEVWSLRMGTSLEDRPRYTPTTCFETFPLPWPPGTEPVPPSPPGRGAGGEGPPTSSEGSPSPRAPMSDEASALPPAPNHGGGAGGEGRAPADQPALTADHIAAHRAVVTAAADLDRLRTAWLNPEGSPEADLKKRTLTNLYNARPTWLANAHTTLDRAVWSAYAWPNDPATTTDEQILERLLALNAKRASD